jgi:hypothetical protein
MSKKTKTRKRPVYWVLAWYRPVGEFKRGERRMLERPFTPKLFRSWAKADQSRKKYRQDVSAIGFIYKKGRKPRKITEIQVNYPAE